MVEILVLLFVAAIPFIIVIGLLGYLWHQLNELRLWEPDQFDYEVTDTDFDPMALSSIGQDTTLSR